MGAYAGGARCLVHLATLLLRPPGHCQAGRQNGRGVRSESRDMPIEAQLALPNNADDLSQPGLPEHHVIGDIVRHQYPRIRSSDIVPKEFDLRFSSLVIVQILHE